MTSMLRSGNGRAPQRRVPWDLTVAIAILVVAAIAGGTALWVGRHNTAVKKAPPPTFAVTKSLVKVPSTAGQNVYIAVGTLHQLHLNSRVGSAASKTVLRGNVIAQVPAAGTTVHAGSLVRLTISRGP